jgi:hypothetical protein
MPECGIRRRQSTDLLHGGENFAGRRRGICQHGLVDGLNQWRVCGWPLISPDGGAGKAAQDNRDNQDNQDNQDGNNRDSLHIRRQDEFR